MSNRIRGIAVAAAALVAISMLGASPARAEDQRPCVVMGEALALGSKMDKGLRVTEDQVATLFDTRGRKDRGRSTHVKVVRVYSTCSNGEAGTVGDMGVGDVTVTFYRPTKKALSMGYTIWLIVTIEVETAA